MKGIKNPQARETLRYSEPYVTEFDIVKSAIGLLNNATETVQNDELDEKNELGNVQVKMDEVRGYIISILFNCIDELKISTNSVNDTNGETVYIGWSSVSKIIANQDSKTINKLFFIDGNTLNKAILMTRDVLKKRLYRV